MPEKLRNRSTVAICLLAILGLYTLLGEDLLHDQPKPSPTPTISPSDISPSETVKLRVRSETNEPIQDVEVEFAVTNGPSSTKRTDSSGYANIEIPKEVDVTIHLRHKNYNSLSYTINSDVDREMTKEFILERKISATSQPKLTISQSKPIRTSFESSDSPTDNSSVSKPSYVDSTRVQNQPYQQPSEIPRQFDRSSSPSSPSSHPSPSLPSVTQIIENGNVGAVQVNGNSNQIQNNVNIK